MATEYRILEASRRTYRGKDDKGNPVIEQRVTVLYKVRDAAIPAYAAWRAEPRIEVTTANVQAAALEAKAQAISRPPIRRRNFRSVPARSSTTTRTPSSPVSASASTGRGRSGAIRTFRGERRGRWRKGTRSS